MKQKNAELLAINDKFMHDELKPWQVMNNPQIIKNKDGYEVVSVHAMNLGNMKTKSFEFGRKVTLDIVK